MSEAHLPLRGRSGAVALVDAELADELAEYRWYLGSHGYPCGRRTVNGYRREGLRGPRVGGAAELVLLHRLVMGLENGDRRQVDHINLDRLDNRRCNLRICTDAENQQNLRAIGGTSSYRGVSWHKDRRKWRAYVQLNGRMHSAGYHDSETDAARAASALRARLMPFSKDAQEVSV